MPVFSKVIILMFISTFLNISLYINNGRGSKKTYKFCCFFHRAFYVEQKVIQKDKVCSGNNQMKYVEKPAVNRFSPELIRITLCVR